MFTTIPLAITSIRAARTIRRGVDGRAGGPNILKEFQAEKIYEEAFGLVDVQHGEAGVAKAANHIISRSP